MQQPIIAVHREDVNGNPAGGRTVGTGLAIDWQDGPLVAQRDLPNFGGVEDVRMQPNGCFVETLIAAAIDRLEFYETAAGGKFTSPYNVQAIDSLEDALHHLHARTADREARKVEGTHQR